MFPKSKAVKRYYFFVKRWKILQLNEQARISHFVPSQPSIPELIL